MKSLRAACAAMAGLVLTSACVSNVDNPVTAEFREAYSIQSVETTLTKQPEVPDRYNEAVMTYVGGEDIDPADQASFEAFAEAKGGLSETNAGDLFLQWLIEDGLEERLASRYTGTGSASIDITIQDTTFPNTATMMLVGEIIGINYDVSMTDSSTGKVLVATNEQLVPFVERSAGAGGGLLGLALRGGGTDRHIMDLDRVAEAVVSELETILTKSEVMEPIAKKLTVSPENIAAPGEPMAENMPDAPGEDDAGS